MSDNIAGSVIVITGASSGMGAAAARHLAARERPSALAPAAPTASKGVQAQSPKPVARPGRRDEARGRTAAG